MTTVTHVLAPIILVRIFVGKESKLSKWDYIWIGLTGGLADIINPHYYLIDRLTSWSHGLPFWILFSVVLMTISYLTSKFHKLKFIGVNIAIYCSLAYLLHLLVDALSGGINLFYPIENYFWGATLIPFKYWIPFDILNIIIIYFLFKWKKSNRDELYVLK